MFNLVNSTANENIKILNTRFQLAEPYPHLIIDDFLTYADAIAAYDAIPSITSSLWTLWGSGFDDTECELITKRGISQLTLLPLQIARVLQALNSQPLISQLERVTGIYNLVPDHTFNGGGLHITGKGGLLRMHADRNRHPRPEKYSQALNLILYINPNWREEYGGQLELISEEGHINIQIAPLFNRAVIFLSNRSTFHGHPKPLDCPIHIFRCSLAVYYFTPRSADDNTDDTYILWK